jgi:hypothetical protein
VCVRGVLAERKVYRRREMGDGNGFFGLGVGVMGVVCLYLVVVGFWVFG